MLFSNDNNNMPYSYALEEGQIQQPSSSNINASSVYLNHTMVLGNNIKHLVILIPNEAHESTNQPNDQYPLANQPYLPQKAIVSPNTMIIWFNADVDHDHRITILNDASSGNVLFDSGTFAFNEASKPVILNSPGTFGYYEANVNNDDKSFVMNGTISVASQQQQQLSFSNTNSTNNNSDIVGTYMVPTQDLDTYISQFKHRGLTVNGVYTFQDLRGGQEGTGDKQTLIVWGANSSTMDFDKLISALGEITSELPYS
jgi:hypothetical protein